MEIKFIGTGGAFDVDFGNSAAILDFSTHRILIDCGHSVFPELVKKGLAGSIDGVILTHLHDDHIGSLSSLILYHQLVLNKGKLKVICQDEAFREQLYSFLAFSLGNPAKRADFVTMDEFPGLGAIDTFGQHVVGMQSWAIYARDSMGSIMYSGDNGNAPGLFEKLEKLELPAPLRIFHEISFYEDSFSHSHFTTLLPFASLYEIFGYHCNARKNPPENPIPLVFDQPDLLA